MAGAFLFAGGSHEAGSGPQLNKKKPHGANPFPPTRLGIAVDQLISAYAGVRHASQSPCVLALGSIWSSTRQTGKPENCMRRHPRMLA
jgi:hypothetical protein